MSKHVFNVFLNFKIKFYQPIKVGFCRCSLNISRTFMENIGNSLRFNLFQWLCWQIDMWVRRVFTWRSDSVRRKEREWKVKLKNMIFMKCWKKIFGIFWESICWEPSSKTPVTAKRNLGEFWDRCIRLKTTSKVSPQIIHCSATSHLEKCENIENTQLSFNTTIYQQVAAQSGKNCHKQSLEPHLWFKKLSYQGLKTFGRLSFSVKFYNVNFSLQMITLVVLSQQVISQ